MSAVRSKADPAAAHAVYRMYDEAGALLYVGCTMQWPIRVAQHQDKPWWHDVRSMTVEWFASFSQALEAEERAQVNEEPVHNVFRGGRIPSTREYRREREAERQRQVEERDAALRARGVYAAWVQCGNCRYDVRELPVGVARAEADCPRCGVRLFSKAAA